MSAGAQCQTLMSPLHTLWAGPAARAKQCKDRLSGPSHVALFCIILRYTSRSWQKAIILCRYFFPHAKVYIYYCFVFVQSALCAVYSAFLPFFEMAEAFASSPCDALHVHSYQHGQARSKASRSLSWAGSAAGAWHPRSICRECSLATLLSICLFKIRTNLVLKLSCNAAMNFQPSWKLSPASSSLGSTQLTKVVPCASMFSHSKGWRSQNLSSWKLWILPHLPQQRAAKSQRSTYQSMWKLQKPMGRGEGRVDLTGKQRKVDETRMCFHGDFHGESFSYLKFQTGADTNNVELLWAIQPGQPHRCVNEKRRSIATITACRKIWRVRIKTIQIIQFTFKAQPEWWSTMITSLVQYWPWNYQSYRNNPYHPRSSKPPEQ